MLILSRARSAGRLTPRSERADTETAHRLVIYDGVAEGLTPRSERADTETARVSTFVPAVECLTPRSERADTETADAVGELAVDAASPHDPKERILKPAIDDGQHGTPLEPHPTIRKSGY